jgi:hypothetical protein
VTIPICATAKACPEGDGAHGVKHAKALLARGVPVRADGAEILSTRQGTNAVRNPLLDFGHSNPTLGRIVGERDRQVVHEAEHLALALKQPAQQVEGL